MIFGFQIVLKADSSEYSFTMNYPETPDFLGMSPPPGPVLLASMFDIWASSRAKAHRGLSEPTEAVQRHMWSAFSAWCIRTQVDPVALTVAELVAYLQSRVGSAPESELTPRYAWRLVTLIDRVIDHWASGQGRAPSRAVAELLKSDPELKHANAESQEPLLEYLSDSEDRTLVSFLKSTVSPDSNPDSGLRWQDIRNRACVALQRGAGLTSLEIRKLKVESVYAKPDSTKVPWKVRAPATGSVRAHDAPVAAWAQPLLAYWMRLRTELEIPGEWLFPATKIGKPWSKVSLYGAVNEVFESAGLVGLKGGSYPCRLWRILSRQAVLPS